MYVSVCMVVATIVSSKLSSIGFEYSRAFSRAGMIISFFREVVCKSRGCVYICWRNMLTTTTTRRRAASEIENDFFSWIADRCDWIYQFWNSIRERNSQFYCVRKFMLARDINCSFYIFIRECVWKVRRRVCFFFTGFEVPQNPQCDWNLQFYQNIWLSYVIISSSLHHLSIY